MDNKAWIVVAKVFAALFLIYAVILWMGVIKDVQMYTNSPGSYTNGLAGVLGGKWLNIALGTLLTVGPLLLFFNKKAGWVLMFGGQLFATFFLAWVVIELVQSDKGSSAGSTILLVLIGIILLLGVPALYANATRARYNIKTTDTLIALSLAVVLPVIHFLVR